MEKYVVIPESAAESAAEEAEFRRLAAATNARLKAARRAKTEESVKRTARLRRMEFFQKLAWKNALRCAGWSAVVCAGAELARLDLVRTPVAGMMICVALIGVGCRASGTLAAVRALDAEKENCRE